MVNAGVFLHASKRNLRSGKELFEQAVELDPKCATALCNYASLLHEGYSRPDEAER